jgi:Cell division protein FtsI/penicillin-binding protein 2
MPTPPCRWPNTCPRWQRWDADRATRGSSIRGTTSDGKLGTVKSTVTPKVLNTIDMTAAEKKLVKEGLYDVVHGTNTYKTGAELASISPGISAKTGTAETYYKGHSTVTLSLASYAPSNDPQVVVALAMPNLSTSDEDNNMKLAKQIYSAYWKTVQSTSTLTTQPRPRRRDPPRTRRAKRVK